MLCKVSPSDIGLYYSRGVCVVHPITYSTYVCKAVRTDKGTLLIPDRPDLPYSMSVEEIKDAYGGEIVDVEIMREIDRNSAHYINNYNFPKVKNQKIIDRVYNRCEKYLNKKK